jgi:hypothetical protein
MSRLCARATPTRVAFEVSARQPAVARAALTSRSTSASVPLRPAAGAAGGLLGRGFGAGGVVRDGVVRRADAAGFAVAGFVDGAAVRFTGFAAGFAGDGAGAAVGAAASVAAGAGSPAGTAA